MTVLVENLQQEIEVGDDLIIMVETLAGSILAGEGMGSHTEVGVILTCDDHISELNSQYRGIEGPTDVLSFAMHEGEVMPDPGGIDILGDVVISVPAAVRQSAEAGHPLKRELAVLTAHGVLHLLGYDHQDEAAYGVMRRKEEKILEDAGF